MLKLQFNIHGSNVAKKIALAIVCLLPLKAMALTVGKYQLRPLLTITGGYSMMTELHQDQEYLFPDGSAFNLYSSSAVHEGSAGAFMGAEYQLQPEFAIQMGLGYYQPSPFVIHGHENQGISGSPDTFNYYNFQYKINLRQLLLETKLLYSWRTIFHPFISLGLGSSFNNAYNYQINYPSFLTFSPEFYNNTQNHFSYRLGLGIDIDATENLRIGIGYSYADFGIADLGAGHIGSAKIAGTLRQTHLNVNAIFAQLTLIA
jgi:opacity protein-like surface antigen